MLAVFLVGSVGSILGVSGLRVFPLSVSIFVFTSLPEDFWLLLRILLSFLCLFSWTIRFSLMFIKFMLFSVVLGWLFCSLFFGYHLTTVRREKLYNLVFSLVLSLLEGVFVTLFETALGLVGVLFLFVQWAISCLRWVISTECVCAYRRKRM